MSQRHSDPPTQNFATQRFPGEPRKPPARQPAPSAASTRRWNLGRDGVAAVLLLLAPLLPWNLYFGLGVPHSSGLLFGLLATATVLSLAALVATYAGGSRRRGKPADRLRVGLNAPYALLVLGFVAFDAVQTVRYGGSATVPGGIGPGAWLGTGGALLSAQPSVTGTAADEGRFRSWMLAARVIGYTSIVFAGLSFSFNLFWRTKAALPVGSSGFGSQNAAIIVTAVVYGVVALATVVVASRWILQPTSSSRLVTTALGASTLVAGIIVWVLPVGREIDEYHGVAQNTSTAGVGFEGYLPWAAAAAIFATLTLLRRGAVHQIDRGIWRAAARKGLLLIAVWCLASLLMRVTDVAVAAALHSSRPPYDSAAMAAFDVVTAALAIWLRINLLNRVLPVAVISALCGVLVAFSVARIVVGVALAPRFAGTAAAGNPVYGSNLVQQITSTFDVVLSGLALGILTIAVITARSVQRRAHPDGGAAPSVDAETTRIPPRSAEEATGPIAVGPGGANATRPLTTAAPRIFRSGDQRDPATAPSRPGQQSTAPRIFRGQHPDR